MYTGNARCTDGVVLIADRKVTNFEQHNRSISYKSKLFSFYYPIVLGFAGANVIYEKFLDEAYDILQPKSTIQNQPIIENETKPILPSIQYVSGEVNFFPKSSFYPVINKTDNSINFHPYLIQLENLVMKLNKEYKSKVNEDFEVLFASKTKEHSVLYYISSQGVSEKVENFKTIGSGESSALVFLKTLWHNDITMLEFINLGYFIINLIERFDIDGGVGVGNNYPQIWQIPDKDRSYEITDDNILMKFKLKSNEMIEKFLSITK